MQQKVNKIYNGSNIDVLQGFQDNSCDAIISDYPYGLSDIDPLKMIKEDVNNKAGFMNSLWDCMPTVEMLKEFYRVLKTGGFCITTFTPRQDLQTVLLYRLMEAGFDVSFSPIYYAYKSGFPKASNYSKVIDKHFNAEREVVGRNPNSRENCTKDNTVYESGTVGKTDFITKPKTPEAQYCDGLYSNSPKPAVEPIIICQKPHGKAKYKQALDWYYERKELLDKGIPEEDLSLYTKNSSGGVWFDNSRIPCNNKKDVEKMSVGFKGLKFDGDVYHKSITQTTSFIPDTQGRFPANLLCGFPISKEELRSEYPEATEEELDKMVSMIENPLDVGRVSKATSYCLNNQEYKLTNKVNFVNQTNGNTDNTYADQGDLSRYFSLTAWSKKHFPNLHNIAEKTLQLQDDVKKTGDLLFVCKTSVSEKNAGLDGFEEKNVKDGRQAEVDNAFQRGETLRQNTHVCVKPIALYNYLITLFSKEGDIILDPFCGSGVTPIACVLTNRKYIGIDISEEYCAISNARVEYWKQQKNGVKSASASTSNVSASTGVKEDIQGNLF
jgi:DNA modification methylase